MVSSMSLNAKLSTPASSRGETAASPARTRVCTASSWRMWPTVNERRNVPNPHSHDGARTSVKTLPIPPCRRTSRSADEPDGVGAGGHPGDDPGRFHRTVRARNAQMLPQQVVQPSSLCQPHYRDQTGRTDQVRVIENRGYLVRCLPLSDAPSDGCDQTLSKSNPPAPQGGIRVSRPAQHTHQSVDQGATWPGC